MKDGEVFAGDQITELVCLDAGLSAAPVLDEKIARFLRSSSVLHIVREAYAHSVLGYARLDRQTRTEHGSLRRQYLLYRGTFRARDTYRY